MAVSPTPGSEDEADALYRTRLGPNDDTPPSVAIVEAIAAAENTDPTEIDVRLYDGMDPDALDALYRHSRGRPDAEWEIGFAVGGFDVTVRSDGRITVS